MILELPFGVLPARGTSLIRLDDEGSLLSAHHYGDLTLDQFERCTAHLSSKDARMACRGCMAKQSSVNAPCPVLSAAPGRLEATHVHCLSFTRGGRDFGTLNIYLADDEVPTTDEHDLLQVMATSMSLALESQLLRSKELGTL